MLEEPVQPLLNAHQRKEIAQVVGAAMTAAPMRPATKKAFNIAGVSVVGLLAAAFTWSDSVTRKLATHDEAISALAGDEKHQGVVERVQHLETVQAASLATAAAERAEALRRLDTIDKTLEAIREKVGARSPK